MKKIYCPTQLNVNRDFSVSLLFEAILRVSTVPLFDCKLARVVSGSIPHESGFLVLIVIRE